MTDTTTTQASQAAAEPPFNPEEFPTIAQVVRLEAVAARMADFMEWAKSKGMFFVKKKRRGARAGELVKVDDTVETLLYDYFNIDRAKLNEERARLREVLAKKEAPDAP